MSYYVWVGPRDIDCIQDPVFSAKICYFSEQNIKGTREANIYGNTFNKYVENKMNEILKRHPEENAVFVSVKMEK